MAVLDLALTEFSHEELECGNHLGRHTDGDRSPCSKSPPVGWKRTGSDLQEEQSMSHDPDPNYTMLKSSAQEVSLQKLSKLSGIERSVLRGFLNRTWGPPTGDVVSKITTGLTQMSESEIADLGDGGRYLHPAAWR